MLRPFGPPRDAQRCAPFVRVAALPVSHKRCTALVAPAAGVMQGIESLPMNKNKKWKLATIAVVTFLLLSLNPEIRFIGLLIESVGLETILIAIESQLILALGIFYRQWLAPFGNLLNRILERLDPLYFRPKISLIRAYPKMVLHSIPFLVTAVHIVAAGAVLTHA